MKKQLKRLVVLAVAMTMFVSSVLSVSAAGLRDVFDAKHYADTYKDLKAAFGDNEELLYQHFINYGLKEKRQMSPIIDLQAYRAAYPDLEAAFGDNWDAYVEHFFAFGAKENRTKGVLFNPLKYAAAYPDVAAAFGSDLKAITKHFLVFGIKEGRTAGVVVKAPAAAPSGGSGGGGQTVTPPPGNSGFTAPPVAAPEKSIEVLTISGDDISAPTSGTLNSKTVATVGITAGSAASIQESVSAQLSSTNKDVVSVTIDATGVASAQGVQATIPKEVIEKLDAVDSTGEKVAITVKNEAGTVTMPLKAIRTAQGSGAAAGSKDIKIEMMAMTAADVKSANSAVDLTGESVTDNDGNIVKTENAVFMKIELNDGSNPVSISAGRAGEIQVTVPSNGLTGKVNVYFVNSSNKLELVGIAEVDGENITFAVDHLTQFVITERKHSIEIGAHVLGMFNKSGNCEFCDKTLAQLQAVCTDATHTTTGAAGSGTCTRCGKAQAHQHDLTTIWETKTCPIDGVAGTKPLVLADVKACQAETDGKPGKHEELADGEVCGTCFFKKGWTHEEIDEAPAGGGEADNKCDVCGEAIEAAPANPDQGNGDDTTDEEAAAAAALFAKHTAATMFDETKCKGATASGGCGTTDCTYTLAAYQQYCATTTGASATHKDENSDNKCDRCGDSIE